MPDLFVRVDGLAEALRALNITEADMVEAVGKRAALTVIAFAKPYPPQSGKPQAFVSDKQRRFVMMAIRTGRIQVPYQRTYATQDAWTWLPSGDGADVMNAHPHAAFVYEPQAKYHKGNWPTPEKIVEKAKGEVQSVAELAIVELIASRGGT